jgi:hypothetical protein
VIAPCDEGEKPIRLAGILVLKIISITPVLSRRAICGQFVAIVSKISEDNAIVFRLSLHETTQAQQRPGPSVM